MRGRVRVGSGRVPAAVALVVLAGLLGPLLPDVRAGMDIDEGGRQDLGEQASLEAVQPVVQWLAVSRSAWTTLAPRQTATVRVGDRVRTEQRGAARLVYFEGSVTEVGGGTNLAVQRLEQTAGGGIGASLFQSLGTTVSRVVQLLDPAASFEVETPAATAFVRGTTPRVDVAASGRTRVANVPDDSGGRVEVEGKDPNRTRVTLQPGQETDVVPNQPPSAPRPMAPGAATPPLSAQTVAGPTGSDAEVDGAAPTAGPSATPRIPPLSPFRRVQPAPTLVAPSLGDWPAPPPNRILEGSPLIGPVFQPPPTVIRAPTRLPTRFPTPQHFRSGQP